ncbi:hypothetical protein [Ornithinimicrobium cerasi]|uniref:hypothetical protein n=1 Tax=Ornithinimicrobium cerasi TaxID=2248773 RepID=UPI000EFFDCA5|nr:hypothetical protein [Ornithinimicrobium cerasi]
MTAPVRAQSVDIKVGGVSTPVEGVSWDHGVNLRAGDVVGSDASVDWAEGAGVVPASQVAHPMRPGWTRTNGAPVTVDVTDGPTTHRVFTGRIDSTGGGLLDGSSSALVDWASRLSTKVKLPPVAFTMPSNPRVPGAGLRRVGLWGTWLTHLAMQGAAFQAAQGRQTSSIYYQSMAGSTWLAPHPDHVTDTLGSLTTSHRIGNPNAAPGVFQGTNVPCMEDVFTVASTTTRRNSGFTSWQLTVDMASDAPTVFHTGRVDLRPTPVASGTGVRLDWTQTLIRVYRVNADGSTALLGSVARADAGGVYTMRWSVVVREDGTATLHGSGGRTAALALTGTGIAMPTTAAAGTVIVTSEGPVSAVQVTRSDSTFLTTQAVSARILRSTFSERSLPGFDFVPDTPALTVLQDQADAERSLMGMPLWVWIDTAGRLVQADPAYLAAQPVTGHFSTTSTGTALDDVRWAVPPSGPYSRVDVRCRFGVTKVRTSPTLLLAVGGQKNHDHGDTLEEFFHPEQDQTWLSPDVWPYLAGRPYPAPPYPAAAQHEFNKGVGSWVGGMRVTESDGDRVGWIEEAHVNGWTVDVDSGQVVGAFEVLDHATILYKGIVNVGASYGMSSMPDQGSVGVWAHRKSQPLPQIRGRGRIDWTDRVTSVEVSGDSSHPVLEHDGGMWTQNSVWRSQIADALAQASVTPAPELALTVAVDPARFVGEHVTADVTYPDGSTLEVDGLVAGISGRLPSDRDQMGVRLVVLSSEWTSAGAAPVGTDFDAPPVVRPVLPPPGTDPPLWTI